MHRCLLIEEILSIIIEQIFFDVDSRGTFSGTCTLLAFALTCRTISEPALDRLWHTQLTLLPLIKTLPSDAWDVYGSVHEFVNLVQPLLPSDWSRFNVYASRVKCFGYNPYITGPVPVHVWGRSHKLNLTILDSFRNSHPSMPLLPNLCRLRFTVDNINAKSQLYADLFFARSLTGLHLDFTYHWCTIEEKQAVSAMLMSLPRLSPLLESFVTDTIPFEQPHDTRWDEWRATRQLWVPSLTSEDLISLSVMPNLRCAQLWTRSADVIPSPENVAMHGFASLRVLNIWATSLDICSALLRLLPAWQLEALTVCIQEQPSAALVQDFVSGARGHCSLSTLESIRLHDTAICRCSVDNEVIDACILAPLLAFTNLRTVEINLPSLVFDKSALITMVSS
ncbi:hypothetical protein AcW1_003344 [Taiwanofungus camphoratus]|nr:hypothetical protein AcW1_003344 [Antrodia cinnamomea]